MWNQSPGLRAMSYVLMALVLTACGGGGGDDGGNGGSVDLSGWWDVEGRPGGSGKAYEPFTIILADHTGTSFWANGSEFTQTGTQLLAIEPNAADPDREIISLTILTANQLEGTVSRYETDVLVETSDIRVTRRTAPTGTFSMAGTVNAQPATVSSTTAYAGVDEGSTDSEFGVYDVAPYERDAHLEVRVEESPLRTRTYTVGVGLGMIEANVGPPDNYEEATAGTVTLTSVGTRLVGTYDLTLTGGAVTGSFDVDVLLPGLP